MCRSVPQMPVGRTRILTSLMPTWGSGTSSSHRPRASRLLTGAFIRKLPQFTIPLKTVLRCQPRLRLRFLALIYIGLLLRLGLRNGIPHIAKNLPGAIFFVSPHHDVFAVEFYVFAVGATEGAIKIGGINGNVAGDVKAGGIKDFIERGTRLLNKFLVPGIDGLFPDDGLFARRHKHSIIVIKAGKRLRIFVLISSNPTLVAVGNGGLRLGIVRGGSEGCATDQYCNQHEFVINFAHAIPILDEAQASTSSTA